jgi:hypothetical protein
MKKLLIGLLVMSSFSALAENCDLLVKDVSLSSEEETILKGNGFNIIKAHKFTSSDLGQLALLKRQRTNGADVFIWDLHTVKYQIVKFWDSSNDQLPGREVNEYLNYVGVKRTLNNLECGSVESVLDHKLGRILKSQMYPKSDDVNHGVVFINN